jgi:hypothetical protein
LKESPEMSKLCFLLALSACLASHPLTAERSQVPEEYNVNWTTQSRNSGDSMPCVGGDIGLNVWVENDELLFYVGRMGCRDENGSLLKMERMRNSAKPSTLPAARSKLNPNGPAAARPRSASGSRSSAP